MDELEAVRSFRRNDVTPNPLAREAARDRLIAHMADDDLVDESREQVPTQAPTTATVPGAPNTSRVGSRVASRTREIARRTVFAGNHGLTIGLSVAAAAAAADIIPMPFMYRWGLLGVVVIVSVGLLKVHFTSGRVLVAAASIVPLSALGAVCAVLLYDSAGRPAALESNRAAAHSTPLAHHMSRDQTIAIIRRVDARRVRHDDTTTYTRCRIRLAPRRAEEILARVHHSYGVIYLSDRINDDYRPEGDATSEPWFPESGGLANVDEFGGPVVAIEAARNRTVILDEDGSVISYVISSSSARGRPPRASTPSPCSEFNGG